MKTSIPLSILDLAPIGEGASAGEALRNARDLAQHAERWGYHRYWLAEHHNMPGIASAATAVVIGHVAAGTQTIRVGSGGVMLPNHAPMVIAEQFGTLEALFPGRIDLGLGRAPGTDQATARALRRDLVGSADTFPDDVLELQALLAPSQPGQTLHAIPGVGSNVPLWLLGSSLFSAQLAAQLGLPFAFASHFAPGDLLTALTLYRQQFRPSQALAAPYAMACVNIVVAERDEEARYLFTSAQLQRFRMRRGRPGPLPPPVDDIDALWSAEERAAINSTFRYSFVGSDVTVASGIAAFIAQTGIQELMLTAQVHDHAARLASFERAAGIAF